MAKLTRRALLKRTSIGVAGVATLGTLTAMPPLAVPAAASSEHALAQQSTATHSGPMVVHVRNFSTGEISIMSGEKEVVLRDPALVTRLLQAAR